MRRRTKAQYNEYIRSYLKHRYAARWRKAIELLGGRCAACGSETQLQFDHIDARSKSFEISDRIAQYAWRRIVDELKKCQLLCFDCHVAKSKFDMVKIRAEEK